MGLARWEELRAAELAAGSSFASLRACGVLSRKAPVTVRTDRKEKPPDSTVLLLRSILASSRVEDPVPAIPAVLPGESSPTRSLPPATPQTGRSTGDEATENPLVVVPAAPVPPRRVSAVPPLSLGGADAAHSVVTLKTDADASVVRVRAIVSGRRESHYGGEGQSARPSFEPLQISVTRLGVIDVKRVQGSPSVGKGTPAKVKKSKREILISPNAEGIELTSRLKSSRSSAIIAGTPSDSLQSPLATPRTSRAALQRTLMDRWITLRIHCARLVSYPLFDTFIILVIIMSCITLTLDSNAVRKKATRPRDVDQATQMTAYQFPRHSCASSPLAPRVLRQTLAQLRAVSECRPFSVAT